MRCSKARRENAFAVACSRDLLHVRCDMVCTTSTLSALFGRWKRGLCRLPAAARAPHGVGCWTSYAVGGGNCTLPVFLQSACSIVNLCMDWSGVARTRVARHLYVASALPRRAAQGV